MTNPAATGAVTPPPTPATKIAPVVASPTAVTREALALLEKQHPARAAFFRMLAVELQALLDGQITFTDRKTNKEVAATEAQACSAIIHCARNGQSVAAGHVTFIGTKLYTTPAGYMASAENSGDFLGFKPARAITEDEGRFLGLFPDPNAGKFEGEGAGKRPKPPRYTCMVAIEGMRRGYEFPSVGFGWWDNDKDRDNPMSVPAQTAISRARRRCLMGLYSLGTPLGGDPAYEPVDVIDAEVPALPSGVSEEDLVTAAALDREVEQRIEEAKAAASVQASESKE